ncbi:hypothetical protein [Cellulosimicrobium sp. TH-20]|uniref:hypothetical protein n=1 Tax=Cellulosimicrobium sp. TH-20 TaxID=1980001 RepID=UPI0011AA7B9B|nr:hypothetical protein [Cellulosimicrobium sp. TH-20]
MTARITAAHGIDLPQIETWDGRIARHGLEGSLSLSYAPGEQDRALRVLDDLVERVRADVEATR